MAAAESAPAPAPVPARSHRRAVTPTLLQMEAVECGAASLGIILAYHGRIVPLEELRLACGVSRDGSKASNMVKAARGYGLTAQGFRKNNPDELRELKPPFIVFWNFNHFLVCEGFGKGKVFLNDPAAGPRVVSPGDFNKSFTGVVLTFARGPEFKPGGEKPSMLRALRRRLAGSELALLYVVLAGLLLVVPGLVIPVFSQLFVDRIMITKLYHWLPLLLTGLGLTALLRALLTELQQHYLLRMETKLALSASGNFFWHILLPIEFFTQRFGGEIGSRVKINDQVAQVLAGQLGTTAVSAVMIIFYAAVMVQYDLLLTLIGVAMAITNLAVMQWVSRARVDRSRKMQMDAGKIVGVSMSGLQSMETLKAMSGESDFFSRWAGYQAKLVNSQQSLGQLGLVTSVVPTSLEALTTVALLMLGGWRIMTGHLTIGQLIAFQSLMASFIGPVTQLVLQELEGNMTRLDDVLRYPPDPQVDPARDLAADPGALAATEIKLTGALELRELTFGYSKLEAPLFDKFSFALKPGMRVALVGGSGCGKSTISRLVCGLYQPWSGEVLFDGKPRPAWPRPVLTGSFAYVDQDIFLFEGTIRENLTLWDKTIPEQYLVQAAKDACIHEDIAARPGGYDSRVEEGGSNFSGGQRQRLEIARALVANPTLLVLDEATSALDPKTEQRFDEALRRRGCTCMIIAHRLSTIRDADEIIVLERGQVLQRGTHEELKSQPGHYAELIGTE